MNLFFPFNKNIFRSAWFILCSVFLSLILPQSICAQYEYLGKLNYTNLALTRLDNIPGVTFIADKSAFDETGQRFFFLGEPATSFPQQMYTLDAATGAIISNPVCPAANATGTNTGHAYGIQYDNVSDTLYSLFFSAFDGSASFDWIEPATGIVHILKALPAGYGSYFECSFDIRDNVYIINGGGAITGINASTGDVVYRFSNTNIFNISFDNLNHTFYGIDYSGNVPHFDSVSIPSGVQHQIASLPAMAYQQIGAWAMDENAGKFMFVARNTGSVSCILNTFYVLDNQSGAIQYQSLYTYAQSTGSFNAENLIEFSFDNKGGSLYALNWFPPNANMPITITSASPVQCEGSEDSFTANVPAGFTSPHFQWQVNGVDAGTDASIFTSSTLFSGDSVRCIFTGLNGCTVNVNDTSNTIAVAFTSVASTATVNITAAFDSVCSGQPFIFTAHAINTGSPTQYQWQVNNISAGTNDSVLSISSLTNGDSIRCIIIPGSDCVLAKPDSSNVIAANVISVNTAVTINASATEVCTGDTVIFKAMALNGGAAPVYLWQINGSNTGITGDSFAISSLQNGDKINCLLTSSLPCASPVTAVSPITITISPVPKITFNPDTLVIKPGQSISLNPVVTGDANIFQWSPSNGLSNPSVINPIANPTATIVYQLLATNNAGCKSSGGETVLVYHPLAMPSAFTPNGDGINDVFRIPPSVSQQIKSFTVFNRWGERVFNTTDSGKGWDGKLNSITQSDGSYVWVIVYYNIMTKQIETAKGTVTLIR